jgi:hypothetical protein
VNPLILADIKTRLRSQIGDTDLTNPNITDDEITTILSSSASEYSRIKTYLKVDSTIMYIKDTDFYTLPTDSYKVKKVELLDAGYIFRFTDNIDQVILLNHYDVEPDHLKITYSRYFLPTEILDKELDLYLLYAEALCYKLMASKTAELIKFSTGEKSVDEGGLSGKYLELYANTEKTFRKKAIKAYGSRANYPKENLNYNLDYPPEGETP